MEHEPGCSRCYASVHVDPEHEWNEGDVCWPCLGAELAGVRQERDSMRARLSRQREHLERLGEERSGNLTKLSVSMDRAEAAEAEISDLKSFVVKLRGKADPAEWRGMDALTGRLALAEADNARLKNDCGDLAAGINRLCGEVRQLQLSVEMACVEPPDGCECSGCSYAAEVNTASQSPTDCGK